MLHKNRKIISLILAVGLISGSAVPVTGATTPTGDLGELPDFPTDATVQSIDNGHGVTYHIKSFTEDGIRKVEMTAENTTDVMVIINDNSEELTIEQYSLVDDGSDETIADDTYIVSEKSYDLDELAEEYKNTGEATGSLGFNNKTYELYRNKYYYARGVSSYGNSYLKIGCTAEYNVKYWALTTSQQARCDNYTKEIRNVNTHKSNALAAASVTSVAVMSAAIFAAPVITAPIAAALITAAVGFYGYSGEQVFSMVEDYRDAADLYAVIKTYPHL